jgi:hypothetical protein
MNVIKGKKIREGEQRRPTLTGGLGIRASADDEDGFDGPLPPPVLPPGVRGAPLPHPQPQAANPNTRVVE